MADIDILYIYIIYESVGLMRVAIVGSRCIENVNLEEYLPEKVTEIISGGAKGVDSCARAYARAKGIKLTEFLPDYRRYGCGAPLRRNLMILENADLVLAFWDGESRGTRYVIENAREMGKTVKAIIMDK